MKHARLSASGAPRWMKCVGAVPFCEERGLEGASSYEAAAGTFAHHIGASCLQDGGAPARWLGNRTIVDGHTVECNQDMVDAVQFYIDTVMADRQPGDLSWVEADITSGLAKLHPDLGGNSDYIRYRPSTRHLWVPDFKFGEGVFVAAVENEQLLTYALGAMLTLPPSIPAPLDVTLSIIQPRIENEEGLVRHWHVTASRVLEFAADLIDAARAVRAGAPLTASEKGCKFCPGRRVCPELVKAQAVVVAQRFDVTQYDPAALADALRMVPLVKARIKALDEFAYGEAVAGRFGPEHGFKLVEKRATRKVGDEAGVKAWAAAYNVDAYETPVMKSPAQLEKGLKKPAKDALAPYIESKSSGTTLVAVDDDRPEAKRLTGAAFEALPAPDNAVSDPSLLGF